MSRRIEIRQNVLGGTIFGTLGKPVQNSDRNDIILRPYQEEMLEHLRTNRYSLLESPMGSGKTIMMLCFSHWCLKKGQKVVILTPRLGINANFRDKVRKGLKINDGEITLPRGIIPNEATTQKIAELKNYLRQTAAHAQIFVCSQYAFAIAMEDKTLRRHLGNVVVLIDEAHHSGFGENDLGKVIKSGYKHFAGVHGFTATAYRTDNFKLLNGDFTVFRRTLREHFCDPLDGLRYCSDFGISIRFYEEVAIDEYEEFDGDKQRKLGSTAALIDAYLDEYSDTSYGIRHEDIPALMLVDDPDTAFRLEKAIRARYPDKEIVQLGSDDGVQLVSAINGGEATKRLTKLQQGEMYDVVIAIRLMNEGIDWVDCAQVYACRISGSLLLIMQREIGRALRLKGLRKDKTPHPSPDHSRIVFFEIGIKNSDKDRCAKSFFEFAVRLKTLCEGLGFASAFRFRFDRGIRERVDAEKKKAFTNPQMNKELSDRLYRLRAAGASADELVRDLQDFREEKGGGPRISKIAATELLIEIGLVDRDKDGTLVVLQAAFEELADSLSEGSSIEDDPDDLEDEPDDLDDDKLSALNARRLNDRLAWNRFREILNGVKITGVEDYVQLLSGHPDVDRVVDLLKEYVTSYAVKTKEILLEMARNGDGKPSSSSKDPETKKLGIALSRYMSPNNQSFDSEFSEKIRALRPDWFIDTAAETKEILLEMARNGDGKPSTTSKDPETKKLGIALSRYMSPSSESFDPEFSEKIRALRPDWFVDTVAETKTTLLEMAKNGDGRPSCSSKDPEIRKLGSALIGYTSPNNRGFDSEFRKEMRALRPDWFIDTAAETKAILLEMARNGDGKPSSSSKDPETKKLGGALSRYMSTTRRRPHDSEFSEKIRALRPDWFVDITAENKATLLEMAENGDKRPRSSSENKAIKKLGNALCRYMKLTHRDFDPEFSEKIRTLRPDWFVDSMVENKATLLEMAKNGDGRPSGSSKDPETKKLGGALTRYTNPNQGTFDLEFSEKIRALRPDWFVDTAAENRATLLEMAKNGDERPSGHSKDPEIKKLGAALRGYTNRRAECFNLEFSEKIRALRPDWFVDSVVENKKALLAKNGGRPSSKSKDPETKKLGQALKSYTNPNNGSFDQEFSQEIRALKPDWFVDITAENKTTLLEIAGSGDRRPSSRSEDPKMMKLGNALCRYTNLTHCDFDSEFSEKIRALRPDWFVHSATENKATLLEMAKNGDGKPSTASKDPETKKLGCALSSYLSTDSEFSEKIRALRPDWFVDTAAENRATLLEMARNGDGKPSGQSKDPETRTLGQVLKNYTNPKRSCFNPEFSEKIRALRPDWFVDSVVENKTALLGMAKNGDGRPSGLSKDPEIRKLGKALTRYTNPNSKGFDQEFRKEMRALRLDWFQR